MDSDLSTLLVSEDEIACEAIVSGLQGLIEIGRTSGNPIPTGEFERLDRATKILAFSRRAEGGCDSWS